MGVHLHKAIGWAVSAPQDPLDRSFGDSTLTLSAHGSWLREKAEHITDAGVRDELDYHADLLQAGRNGLLQDCVLHVPQLDGGTLLLIPPTYLRDWCRMDDDLDCAFMESETVEDRIVYTRSNPYSFSHLWMDAHTGQELTGPAGDAVARSGSARGDDAAMRLRFKATGEFAFADPWDAANRLAPAVPRDIVHLVQHLGSFLDPQTLLQLRPARAVWMA